MRTLQMMTNNQIQNISPRAFVPALIPIRIRAKINVASAYHPQILLQKYVKKIIHKAFP